MQGWADELASSVECFTKFCVTEERKDIASVNGFHSKPRGFKVAPAGFQQSVRKSTRNPEYFDVSERSPLSDQSFCNNITPMIVNTNENGICSEPLLRAADRGDTQSLLFILKTDATLINGKDPSGNTALHLAAKNGHIEACTLLWQVCTIKP
jgi:ankyrin repeat protein